MLRRETFWVCLFIEILLEGRERILFQYAAFPPGGQESRSVAGELYECGQYRQHTYPETSVPDGRVGKDYYCKHSQEQQCVWANQ